MLDPYSIFIASGCIERGCATRIVKADDVSLYHLAEVYHTGKNPEAYRRFSFSDLEIKEYRGPYLLKEAIIDWIQSVHDYEDRRDET